jgi:hypothetical protein
MYRWDPEGSEQTVSAPNWLVTLAFKPKTRSQAWARAALDRECKAVAAAQPGTRNDTLNTAAFNLFQIVAGGGLDEQEVRDRLFEAAQTCGLVSDDGAASVEATIDSAYTAARTQPRTRPQPGPQPAQPRNRAVIQIVAGQLPRAADEIIDALLASGIPIFSRGNALVEPVAETVPAADGRKTVTARLRAMDHYSLLWPIAEAAEFQRYDLKRNAWVETNPPMDIVRMILSAERRWRFPRCSGIITTPTLRPDGSLLATPGYDPESQLYLLPGFQAPPIPENPSKQEALDALKILTDLLSEFSFKAATGEREGRLNRSIALSGLLTTLVRGSLPTAPMHLIRADTPGTGKSYLVDVISTIATGRWCHVITAARSADETEKRIGAILLDGSPIVSLDNCTHDLGGELLCQMSERPVIKIRILGRSDMPACDCHTAVFATGNNIGFKGDMVRRGFVCTLEALDERPELREFKTDASSSPPPIGVPTSPPHLQSSAPILRPVRRGGFATHLAAMRNGLPWCVARLSGSGNPIRSGASRRAVARTRSFPISASCSGSGSTTNSISTRPLRPPASSQQSAHRRSLTTSTPRCSRNSCCGWPLTRTARFPPNGWANGCAESAAGWWTSMEAGRANIG